jgi:hypothetical protein
MLGFPAADVTKVPARKENRRQREAFILEGS